MLKKYSMLINNMWYMIVLIFIMQILLPSNFLVKANEVSISNVKYEVVMNQINGEFTVENISNDNTKDISYRTRLVYRGVSENYFNIINEKINSLKVLDNNNFYAKFIHEIPSNAPNGGYYLYIELIDNNGGVIQNEIKFLTIENNKSKDFIVIIPNSTKIITNDGESEPLVALKYNQLAAPRMKMKVKNIGTSWSTTFNIRAKIYDKSIAYAKEPIVNVKLNSVSFLQNNEKEIYITLPSFSKEGSYNVQLFFEDNNGNIFSGISEASFVVKGIEAKISSHSIELKDNILENNFWILKPQDDLSLNGVKILIKTINDYDKSVLFEEEKIVTLTENENTISFKNNFDLKIKSLTSTVNVFYNDKLLDSSTKNLSFEEPQIIEKDYFTDIKNNKYGEAINTLADFGILKGYPDGTFKPLNNISRAEFCVLITFMLNKQDEVNNVLVEKNVFNDVENNHWAAKHIKLVKDLGYVSGYPDGSFKKSNPITFAETITVITKIVNKGENIPYEKIWYDGYLKKAEELEITKDINVIPSNNILRGEVVQIINNALFKL